MSQTSPREGLLSTVLLLLLLGPIRANMTSPSTNDWQARGAEKRARCQTLIPKPWHLPSALLQTLKHPLESSKNNLIELGIVRRSGLLTDKELKITEAYDVQSLLKALSSGELSSLEVTVAFCKRAAIAQQLVWSILTWCLNPCSSSLTLTSRRPVSPRYSSKRPRSELSTWMPLERRASLLALYMGCQSASKTAFRSAVLMPLLVSLRTLIMAHLKRIRIWSILCWIWALFCIARPTFLRPSWYVIPGFCSVWPGLLSPSQLSH